MPDRRQRGIAAGMAAGMAWAVAVLWGGAALWPVTRAPLEVVGLWLLVPALCLIAMIGRLAQRRFFQAELTEGEPPAFGTPAQRDAAVLQNTLEQSVLAALVWPALALSLPQDRLGAIPALACGFVVTRLAFWAGYGSGAVGRAFGFAGTFYATVLAALWTLWLWAA